MPAWIIVLLLLAGAVLELLGVAFVAEDLTGKGPRAASLGAKRQAAQLAHRTEPLLRRVGIRRPGSIVLSPAPAGLSLTSGRPKVKVDATPGRTLEQKVANLEASLGRIDDRVEKQEELLIRIDEELDSLPARLEPRIQELAELVLSRSNRERLPIQRSSFLCLLFGIPISLAGSLASLSL